MKIAYVMLAIAPEIINGGVGEKIKKQMSLWNEYGHEVCGFALAPQPFALPDVRLFMFDAPGFLRREIARAAALARMMDAIASYHPDVIYLRFGLYTHPLYRLFSIAPTVLEINSNDLDEYRARGTFFYWLNRLTRGLTFTLAAGLVASSQELAAMNAAHKKPTCVISNGALLEEYAPLPAPNNAAPVLTLVGSPGMAWHGADKLIDLARRYPDLTINIIGYSASDMPGALPPNLRALGYLTQQEVRNVLAQTDAAFGTLALHRKNMQEASPLKTREALLYGIPVILAYLDTDLENLNLPALLRLPNTEDNVKERAEEIYAFARRVQGTRIPREAILPRIDQRVKERQRLEFFQRFSASV